ncbi:MAG: putative hydrolase of the HAD superfamily [Verrucomicrobiales bacterium]|jgi:putative hydrolase of the HAD superfamily
MLNFNVKAIGFDLDNTLIDRDHAVHSWLASVLVEQPEVLADAIAYDDSGFLSRSTFYDWIAEKVDWADDGAGVERRFQAEVKAMFRIDPAVQQLLRDLKAHGYPLALLTNGDGGFQLKKFGLLDSADAFHPGAVHATGDLGFHKPDRRAFDAMTNSLPVPAEQILYVGDNPENDIVGGNAAGLKTCWIQLADHHACEIEPDLKVRSVLELRDLLLRENG